MVSKKDSNAARLHRHTRVRGKISGTAERPRLDVYRSLNHIYAQVIDDVKGVTLVSAGEESAFELKRLLKADGLRAEETRQGEAEFYVSDQPEDFERIASVFLQEDIRHVARRIDIDRY